MIAEALPSGHCRGVPSPSRVTDEAGLSALCRALAPEQVQVTYCANDALPFRVEWEGDLGSVSFAGSTPDDAAERALAGLASGRVLPPSRLTGPSHTTSSATLPAAACPASEPEEFPTEPTAQVGWAEAMRERIQQIEDRSPVGTSPRGSATLARAPIRADARRPNLRLVR